MNSVIPQPSHELFPPLSLLNLHGTQLSIQYTDWINNRMNLENNIKANIEELQKLGLCRKGKRSK